MSDPTNNLRERLVAAEPSVPAGDPRTTRECEVIDRWKESPRYLGIRARVPQKFREAHRRPAQYVTLSPGAQKPRFLVIASAPNADATSWEFLVDRDTELGRSLESLDEDGTITISPPEGSGFPVDDVEDGPLYCFTTGSGIASICPVAEWYLEAPDTRPDRLVLFHGEYAREDHPYQDRQDTWTDAGIRVVRCDESTAPTRYVQQAFLADDLSLDGATVFLAGAPVMKRAVVDMLEEQGFPIRRAYTNV